MHEACLPWHDSPVSTHSHARARAHARTHARTHARIVPPVARGCCVDAGLPRNRYRTTGCRPACAAAAAARRRRRFVCLLVCLFVCACACARARARVRVCVRERQRVRDACVCLRACACRIGPIRAQDRAAEQGGSLQLFESCARVAPQKADGAQTDPDPPGRGTGAGADGTRQPGRAAAAAIRVSACEGRRRAHETRACWAPRTQAAANQARDDIGPSLSTTELEFLGFASA